MNGGATQTTNTVLYNDQLVKLKILLDNQSTEVQPVKGQYNNTCIYHNELSSNSDYK